MPYIDPPIVPTPEELQANNEVEVIVCGPDGLCVFRASAQELSVEPAPVHFWDMFTRPALITAKVMKS